MTAQQKLLSTVEVATMLNVDPRTVQRRAEAGELPTVAKMPGSTGAYIFDAAVIEPMAVAS